MSKQTAVEWFYNQLIKNKIIQIGSSTYEDKVLTKHEILFQQAKEMEKEQMIDAFGVGCHLESKRLIGYHDIAEQYYEQTYGGNK